MPQKVSMPLVTASALGCPHLAMIFWLIYAARNAGHRNGDRHVLSSAGIFANQFLSPIVSIA